MTLLNNWENTGFKFDEKVLVELMKEAKHLGVDMFLLDDGWFANKYPRNNDHTGLGDWEATKSKLPNGVPALVAAAKEAGVKFGIWIEPVRRVSSLRSIPNGLSICLIVKRTITVINWCLI